MKTGNILLSVAFFMLIMLPVGSKILLHDREDALNVSRMELADRMKANEIRAVELRGAKASRGMISVAPAGIDPDMVVLRTPPGDVELRGDTLDINITDNSAMYQGTIRISRLRVAIYPYDTVYFKKDTLSKPHRLLKTD